MASGVSSVPAVYDTNITYVWIMQSQFTDTTTNVMTTITASTTTTSTRGLHARPGTFSSGLARPGLARCHFGKIKLSPSLAVV